MTRALEISIAAAITLSDVFEIARGGNARVYRAYWKEKKRIVALRVNSQNEFVDRSFDMMMSRLNVTPKLYFTDMKNSVSELYDGNLEQMIENRRIPIIPLVRRAMDLLNIVARYKICTDLKLSNIVAKKTTGIWDVRLINLDADFCENYNDLSLQYKATLMKRLLINNEKKRLLARGPRVYRVLKAYADKDF